MRRGLGKGLGALLSTDETDLTVEQSSADVNHVDIRKIEPNRGQPRQYFDQEALEELADSIRAYGVIQPLILKDNGDHYSIIAGERRFRAARLANLDSVPAVIKDYTDLEILQIALVENIQRQDLTPIEEAQCYKRLMDEFFFSQEDIASKVGKSRAAISSAVRLLELDGRVQELVSDGRLTVSHARVLLAIKDGDSQLTVADQIVEGELSVRISEALVAEFLREDKEEPKRPEEFTTSEDRNAAYRQAEEELKALFGAKVSIMQGKKKGKIEIEYYSPEELDRLLNLFKGNL